MIDVKTAGPGTPAEPSLAVPQDPPGRVHAGYMLAALEPPRSHPTPVRVAGGRVEAIFRRPTLQTGDTITPADDHE